MHVAIRVVVSAVVRNVLVQFVRTHHIERQVEVPARLSLEIVSHTALESVLAVVLRISYVVKQTLGLRVALLEVHILETDKNNQTLLVARQRRHLRHRVRAASHRLLHARPHHRVALRPALLRLHSFLGSLLHSHLRLHHVCAAVVDISFAVGTFPEVTPFVALQHRFHARSVTQL